MTKEERAREITNGLYEAYGSDSGYLFSIEPKYRDSVQAIVEYTLSTVIVEGIKCK